MYEENEKSIFNYNMLFNKINSDNLDEKIDYNTNLISDINLQNFDIKRYEYYTNLLYIYNKDPATLYNLLKKYYNIKNFKSKERKIIKYISNYARLLKDNPDKDESPGSNVTKDILEQTEKQVEHVGGVVIKAGALENMAAKKDVNDDLEKYSTLYSALKAKIPDKIKRSDVLSKAVEAAEVAEAGDTGNAGETKQNLKKQKQKL